MIKKKFNRVLVANRGEIACRVIYALREKGIESVAIYAQEDEQSLHVRMADYALKLTPGKTPNATYLDVEQIVALMVQADCDAVHPGYGFLSENAHFAERVLAAKKVFIGPTPDAINLLGDKIEARKLMEQQGIPIVPGTSTSFSAWEETIDVAKKIGYPVILKAAAGGGGRGIRIVYKEEELKEAFLVCQREALNYFANGDLFLEKYIQNPKHIEVQVLFDHFGHGIHLFERDCSVQRRNQKLLEEAPSSFLTAEQRNTICELALKAARAANYRNAGTVEFICENPDHVFFMEMNTRVQVEHPVTEAITGIDIIREQLDIAAGNPLTIQQEDVQFRGHAIEARINAENIDYDFRPTPGHIKRLTLPRGPFVRVDSHLYEGYTIPDAFDSMVAKVIVWGETREVAIARLKRALRDFVAQGISTTCVLQERIVSHPSFQSGKYTTKFIGDEMKGLLDKGSVGEVSQEELVIMSGILLNQELL